MNRYFIEVAYLGKGYAGFQVQHNAITIQAEVEKALQTYYRREAKLTGSSRTDAAVNALQNYFHIDWEGEMDEKSIYNLNSILPAGIVIKSIRKMDAESHCRFDAVSREYRYYTYAEKNPFLQDTAYYFPYSLDKALMKEAAAVILKYTDFQSFSKRNTQVKTFECRILESEWVEEGACLVYKVKANRFLRGMVRGLVATMLQVGRGKISVDQLGRIIEGKDSSKADFAVPGHGLFLVAVEYPAGYFGEKG